MIDQEQLKLAAKAAGIYQEPVFYPNEGVISFGDKCTEWDPLNDDGDAFRLAVKLRLLIQFTKSTIIICDSAGKQLYMFGLKDDPYAATRRAIVRAAAEIGKGMNATDT